jgi:hypothetical protein
MEESIGEDVTAAGVAIPQPVTGDSSKPDTRIGSQARFDLLEDGDMMNL